MAFSSIRAALNYLALCNPARAKSINILEPDKQIKSSSCHDPAKKYAAISLAVKSALRTSSHEQRAAFYYCEVGKEGERIHPEDMGKLLGVHQQTIRRWLREIKKELATEFKNRGLLLEEE